MSAFELPHLVQGFYRYSERDDLQVVRFKISLQNGQYVARMWTDDLRRNLYARGPGTREIFQKLHGIVDEQITAWLREDAACPRPTK